MKKIILAAAILIAGFHITPAHATNEKPNSLVCNFKAMFGKIEISRTFKISIKPGARVGQLWDEGSTPQKFIITRGGNVAGGWSLIGYFIDENYVTTVRIDGWDGNKIYVNDTYMHADNIGKGTCK